MNWQSRDDERVARALDSAPTPYERDDRSVVPGPVAVTITITVTVAERIREASTATGLEAAPAFRDALRARLLAEGAALLPHPRFPADAGPGPDPLPGPAARPTRSRHEHGPPPRSAGRRRRQRQVAAAGVLTVAFLSASMVTATGGALPDDPLEQLRRRVQGVESVLAGDDIGRGHRHLELARTGVRMLAATGPSAGAGTLVDTLDQMDSDTRAGVRLLTTTAVSRSDDAELVGLGAWTTDQSRLLSTATPRLPGDVRRRAADSLALLGTVSARVASLRGTLDCACPAVVPVDDLGPLPCSGCTGRTVTRPTGPPSEDGAPPAGTAPTVVATSAVPGTRQPDPTTGVPAPVPTRTARPPEPPGPSAQPPADPSTPAPRPPEQPDPTGPPPTTNPPFSPDPVVTDLLGGLLEALGVGG